VRVASKRFRKLSYKIQNTMGDVNHIVNETIQGFAVVKSYGGQALKHNVLIMPLKKTLNKA
jgi:subfamily B ATP-binding cassette protein MsbA